MIGDVRHGQEDDGGRYKDPSKDPKLCELKGTDKA